MPPCRPVSIRPPVVRSRLYRTGGEYEEDVPVDDGDDEGADQQVDVRLQERLLDGVLRKQIIEINTNIKKINKGNKINSNLKKKSFRRPPGPGPRPPRPSGYPAC